MTVYQYKHYDSQNDSIVCYQGTDLKIFICMKLKYFASSYPCWEEWGVLEFFQECAEEESSKEEED